MCDRTSLSACSAPARSIVDRLPTSRPQRLPVASGGLVHDGARCCARATAWQAGALARLRRQVPVRFMKGLYTSCLGPPPMPSISFPSPAPPVASRPLDAVVIRHCVRVLLVGRVAQHLVSRKPPILRRSNVPITRRTRGPNRCADRLRARAVPRGVDGGGNGAPHIRHRAVP